MKWRKAYVVVWLVSTVLLMFSAGTDYRRHGWHEAELDVYAAGLCFLLAITELEVIREKRKVDVLLGHYPKRDAISAYYDDHEDEIDQYVRDYYAGFGKSKEAGDAVASPKTEA